ncbi:MAG: baseplate protein [Paraburkholderia sp.]|uniref:baseplate assembly protein n=1 Tax=Paraburkholderia sp. TaxID=1926495 RepID=UPI001206A188|nr:baseplate J/gp47 family protein [Paraburkholderia sp.]TAM00812.1 MAG: baseplate protein [Paraburkholderia sp.]
MNLPEPHFIDRDPQAITAEIVADYEKRSGKTLYPAQVEHLLIDLIAYRESLVRIGLQEAARQNLVAYARKPMLDYLGELVGVTRLPEQPARTTLRFGVAIPLAHDLLVPTGTRAESSDGAVIFMTSADAVLQAGQQFVDVGAICEADGIVGNGRAPGQINRLFDALDVRDDVEITVVNISPTDGGADEEEDDPLRERIVLAPENYSNAGHGEAYEARVRAVHQNIIDVAVLGPEDGLPDGHVEAYPLTRDGLPGDDLLVLIEAQLNQRKRRPLTDYFRARMPQEVRYRIAAGLVLLRGFDQDAVMSRALIAAQRYAQDRRSRLGRDLVRSQLNAALHVPGVYRVILNDTFADRELARHEWATCDDIDLAMRGIHDE